MSQLEYPGATGYIEFVAVAEGGPSTRHRHSAGRGRHRADPLHPISSSKSPTSTCPARECYRKIGFVDVRRKKEKFGRIKDSASASTCATRASRRASRRGTSFVTPLAVDVDLGGSPALYRHIDVGTQCGRWWPGEDSVLMVDSPAEVGATVTYRDGWSTTALVVQRVVHHPHAGMAQRVDRMHQDRVPAVQAGFRRPICRRECQMVARRAADYVEGANPIEQSEVDRRGRGGRPKRR